MEAESIKNEKTMLLFTPFIQSIYFRSLYLGQLISFLGSSITSVILPIIIMQHTNSTLAMGTVMSLYSLAFVLVLPFAGMIVDKLNRVSVMLTVDILRFIIMGFFACLLIMDLFFLPLLYVGMVLVGLLDGLFQPAYASTRAKVFTPDIRNAANSLTQISNQAINLLGPTIGGIMITTFSSGICLGLDALTYIFSFFFLLKLRTLPLKKAEPTNKLSHIRSDFTEGFLVLKNVPWLWVTILAFSIINICLGGIMRVILPWLVSNQLHHEPYVYGLLISASGVGAIASGLIFGLRKKWHKRGLFAYGGVACSAIAVLFIPFFANIPSLLFLMFVEGAGIMMFALIWETSLQEMVPEEKFGRVASLDMLGSFALLPIGYILTGWGADWLGSQNMTILLCTVVLLVVSLAFLHKDIRNFD